LSIAHWASFKQLSGHTFKVIMDQVVEERGRQESGESTKPKQDNHPAWINSLRERSTLLFAITGLLIATVGAIAAWWVTVGGYVSTDDAFIDARPVPISSQVNAAVVDVPVTDNELVLGGAVLVRLDDRDFRAQVDQAEAQVDQDKARIGHAEAELSAQQARIDQAEKQAASSQAALTFAEQQDQRYQRLVKRGAVTVEQAQQYTSNLLQAQAAYAAAQANTVANEKQLPVLQTERKQAEAQLEQGEASLDLAKTNLSRTVITAPVTGRVARLTAAKGEYAAVGQPLMVFVPRHVWVTANFKETELQYVQPGARVDIEIDAYPNRIFEGHVDTIQPGSGTAFSLLPAENATGNYVKIVQRVPVKIVFDKEPDVLLGPGMSVVPQVRTGPNERPIS
jgi:membrane fusion protein, multidrug efflux system